MKAGDGIEIIYTVADMSFIQRPELPFALQISFLK
jgi:hypothetical protein